MRVTVLRGEYTICDEVSQEVMASGKIEVRPKTRVTAHDAAGKSGEIVALSLGPDDVIVGAQVALDGAAPTDRWHFPLDALTHEREPAAVSSVADVPLTVADLPVEMLPAPKPVKVESLPVTPPPTP